MQYAANLDETPAYMGGKENTWRRLNLDGQFCTYVHAHVYMLTHTSMTHTRTYTHMSHYSFTKTQLLTQPSWILGKIHTKRRHLSGKTTQLHPTSNTTRTNWTHQSSILTKGCVTSKGTVLRRNWKTTPILSWDKNTFKTITTGSAQSRENETSIWSTLAGRRVVERGHGGSWRGRWRRGHDRLGGRSLSIVSMDSRIVVWRCQLADGRHYRYIKSIYFLHQCNYRGKNNNVFAKENKYQTIIYYLYLWVWMSLSFALSIFDRFNSGLTNTASEIETQWQSIVNNDYPQR